LALPLADRIALAESLLESLRPYASPSETDELAEITLREEQIARGEVELLSEDELLRRVQANRRPK